MDLGCTLTKSRKLNLSSGEPPRLPGNSQSKSRPSKLYFLYRQKTSITLSNQIIAIEIIESRNFLLDKLDSARDEPTAPRRILHQRRIVAGALVPAADSQRHLKMWIARLQHRDALVAVFAVVVGKVLPRV